MALDTIDTMRTQAIAAAAAQPDTSSDEDAVACEINIAVSAMQVVLEEAKKEEVVSAIEGTVPLPAVPLSAGASGSFPGCTYHGAPAGCALV